MKNQIRIVLAALLTAALTVSAQAQLKITEVQSSEAGTGHGDWFELSNLGSSSVNVTGYKMDDNSSNVVANSVSMSSLTLAAGESAVYVESSTFTAFTNWWGITSPIQVGTYAGSGVSLGAGGDQVNIWDSGNSLVDYVWFGAATTGHTFDLFDSITRQATHESVAGVDGAFTSADGNIGSPGIIVTVPEPSAFALAGFGLLALLKSRNRKA